MKLENKTSFIVKSDDWSPYELKALISNFDGFLGTRMHSNIFATSVGVPTVAIAYEKKTNGIMHMLDLNDYVVEINNISSDELIFKINKIMNGKNNAIIRKKLNSKIVDIRKEVMEKMKNMSDLY